MFPRKFTSLFGRAPLWSLVVLIGVMALGCSRLGTRPIEDAPEKFHPVLERLRDDDFKVRMKAAEELGRMGRAAEPTVPYLIETLKDPAVKVRISAAAALGSMGTAAEEAIPELKKATTREYNEWQGAREAAERALRQVEGYR